MIKLKKYCQIHYPNNNTNNFAVVHIFRFGFINKMDNNNNNDNLNARNFNWDGNRQRVQGTLRRVDLKVMLASLVIIGLISFIYPELPDQGNFGAGLFRSLNGYIIQMMSKFFEGYNNEDDESDQ